LSSQVPGQTNKAVSAQAEAPVVAAPVDRMLDHGAYMWERNRRRLLILLVVLTLAIVLFSVRGIVDGVIGLITSVPSLAFTLLYAAFFMIVQFGALMWFLARPRQYTVTPDNPQVGLSFDSYRGQPDLLDHAKSTVRILRGIPKFRAMGGEPPKGMLLSGAPGTGKSYLAGIIAAEANLPFIYIDASGLSSMWMGMDALMVMSLFGKARKLARKYAPPGHPGACILFMDELDSIGMSRSGMQGGPMVGGMGAGGLGMGMRMGLNTMLNQMDSLGQFVEDRMWHKLWRWLGIERGPVPPKPVVFVIGATNRPDVLDPALTRPGRLDRKLEVHLPDGDGRKDIIQFYLVQKAHDPDISIDLMVVDSMHKTPVEIKTAINEALIIAHDNGREKLTYKDWLAALDMREMGLKQPIRMMNREERRSLAYHEAGHAVAAHYLLTEHRIQKATIIRRGDALGFVLPVDKEERYGRTAEHFERSIMVSLGSRAAEEEMTGAKRTGAGGGPGSDLWNATNTALSYIGAYGMGPTLVGLTSANPETLRLAHFMLDHLYKETQRLIREKANAVHAVANALLEREELIGEELDEVFHMAEEAHPELIAPFERMPLQFPKAFEGVEALLQRKEHSETTGVAASNPSLIEGGRWPTQ